MMRLTTDHPQSSYGIPVFVDGTGEVYDYADGFQRVRHEKGWNTTKLAEILGVSRRTVEGWEQGRMPSKTALLLLQQILS
jgi:predicted transcriptional regulator